MQTEKKKRILFISHNFSRTGAPMVLFDFLVWLKNQNIYDFEIFSIENGPLEYEFNKLAQVHTPSKPNLIKLITNKILARLNIKSDYKLPSSLSGKKFDLIYINTIVPLDITSILYKKFNCPIICHVHENSYSIKAHYSNQLNNEFIKYVSHFIAVSESTQYNLIHDYNIPESKTNVVYELIHIDKIKKTNSSVQQIKDELNIHDEFIVGGSGTSTWRKGIDLFVNIAVELNKIEPVNNIKLVWLGDNKMVGFNTQYEYEAERLGVKDKIIFPGLKPNVQDYFQIFDVFTLTSREDPFPLVALEAAYHETPVILFDNSGGMPELFREGKGGIVVPYADVSAMAKNIIFLRNESNKRKQLGIEAKKMIHQFDVNVIGSQLLDVIKKKLK